MIVIYAYFYYRIDEPVYRSSIAHFPNGSHHLVLETHRAIAGQTENKTNLRLDLTAVWCAASTLYCLVSISSTYVCRFL